MPSVGGLSRFQLLNRSHNPPAVSRVGCRWHRVSGGGLGASPANGCRGPSGVGRSSEASPRVGVCKSRFLQSDAVPSTHQWSRPLYTGRFSGGVASRRLTLSLGSRLGMGRRAAGWSCSVGLNARSVESFEGRSVGASRFLWLRVFQPVDCSRSRGTHSFPACETARREKELMLFSGGYYAP